MKVSDTLVNNVTILPLTVELYHGTLDPNIKESHITVIYVKNSITRKNSLKITFSQYIIKLPIIVTNAVIKPLSKKI